MGKKFGSPKAISQLVKALEEWRDHMVSFDGRNRQLFYKRLKTGDVPLDDGNVSSEAVTSLLSGRSVSVSDLYPELFKAAKNKKNEIDSSLGDEEFSDDEVTILVDPRDWAIKLKKFEAVYRKARENFDEKNVETCFLAIGFATWELPSSGPTPNAPVLLYPLKIDSNSRGNSDFSIRLSGEPFINKAFAIYMEKEFGLDAEIFELSTDESKPHLVQLQELNDILQSKVKGYSFQESKLIGNFSFQKYPMLKDLEKILKSGDFHHLLAAFAGDPESITEVSSLGTEESLEALSNQNPLTENLIYPADSTQHQAISAVLGGKSIVIQGPPGSGKSQTIANLMAEAVAKNKSVLFVAEKRAAIDAVINRLDRVGLGGVVLDLHGEPDRRTIASSLLAAIKSHRFAPQLTNVSLKSLVAAKSSLNARWRWLNQNSEIKDLSGQPLSRYQLLIELGESRKNLSQKHIKLIEPSVWQLERLTQSERESALLALKLLDDLDYFNQASPYHSLLIEFEALQLESDFESLSEAANKYIEIAESAFWTRTVFDLQALSNLELLTISELSEFIEKVRKHSVAKDLVDLTRIGRIVEISVALKSLAIYRSETKKNILSAYFAQRRAKSEIYSYLAPKNEMTPGELYELVQDSFSFVNSTLRNDGCYESFQRIEADFDRITFMIESLSTSYKTLQEALKGTKYSFINDREKDYESLKKLVKLIQILSQIPPLREALRVLRDLRLNPVVDSLNGAEFEFNELEMFWSYAWMSSALEYEVSSIKEFPTDSFSLDGQIRLFSDLDGQNIAGNAGKILTLVAERARSIPAADLTILKNEAGKTRAWKPFRKLLQQIPDSIQTLKPVMAMSPLAVSQLLPCNAEMFDIVIFDEASQIRPHDAVPAIYRASQVVIAGDRFQLPPTEFGEKIIEDEYLDDENIPDVEVATFGMESILVSAQGVFGNNVKPLGLHYRSNDEKLISWSNFNIYRKAGEGLFTFPSRAVTSEKVLRYSYLPDIRIASMSDPNFAEIESVKLAILEHIRLTPNLTLGVIAFGVRHAVRLQDAINILERENDEFFAWKSFWLDKSEQFFIKNIEKVQGDERDAIIISPGYAPNLDGTMPLQFGTLNRQGGERRLNVAASRAKEYVHLITSMRSSDIELKRTKSTSIGLLKSYLDFMENHGRLTEPEVGFNTATTPFEEEILNALKARGLQIDCQVGDSGFKIDFAVRDKATNQYILAIEADGATYHSSAYARERDYMRQRILEARGWHFVRIWSTDWWRDPQAQVRRVLAALDDSPKIKSSVQQANIYSNQDEQIYSNHAENEEFLIFRGLLAKNPTASETLLLQQWMEILGKQRVTEKLDTKFKEFLREARRSLDDL
jgi:very-short-patch-repair endonuclease